VFVRKPASSAASRLKLGAKNTGSWVDVAIKTHSGRNWRRRYSWPEASVNRLSGKFAGYQHMVTGLRKGSRGAHEFDAFGARRSNHSLAAVSRHSDADLSAAMPACFISLIRSMSIVAKKYFFPSGGAFFGTEGLASLAFELFFPAISYAPIAWFLRQNGPTRCVSQQAQSGHPDR
jgi:hypothetical protein